MHSLWVVLIAELGDQKANISNYEWGQKYKNNIFLYKQISSVISHEPSVTLS